MAGKAPEAELPIESPQNDEPVKGLVPRSMFWWAAGLIVLLLLGFFARDVKKSMNDDPAGGATLVDKAASAVDLGTPPSIEDIRTAARNGEKRAAEAAKPASAPQAASAAEMADASGLEKPAVKGARAGAVDAASPNAPLGSGRPARAVEGQHASSRSGLDGGADTAAAAQRQVEALGAPIFALEDNSASSASGGGASEGQRVQFDPRLLGIEPGRSTDAAAGRSSNDATGIAGALAAAMGQKQAQGSKDVQWMKDYSSGQQDVSTSDVVQMDTANRVLQGTRIPVASLEAINSDLPGSITARSTDDIYDSFQQRRVLIPKHTRFFGSYSSEIRPGQTRLLMAFKRMVLPDGRSVDLTGAQGVDNLGRAGVEGEVDNHFLKMFGHSFAIAWISSRVTPKGLTTTTSANGSTSTTSVAGDVLNQVAQQILQRNAHIPPTINKEIGTTFFITLSKDVLLPPLRGMK